MKLKYVICLLILSSILSSCSKKEITTQDNYEVVELPDGSIVYLNQYSELEYIEAFDQRKVAISGECYFSVEASDKSFTVTGKLGEIEVLGTEFSVQSDAQAMKVEVEEGIVEFNAAQQVQKITKGQLASFEKGAKSIETGKATLSFKKWMSKLRIELKRFDKEINDEAQDLEEKLNKKARELEKEADKIGKEIEDVGKQMEKSFKKINN